MLQLVLVYFTRGIVEALNFSVEARWNSMNFKLFFTKERKYSKLSFQ